MIVLFAMTKPCFFSQSTCRSLRLMSFQEVTQLLPGRSMPKYFFRKMQPACSDVSFSLLEINLLLKFIFFNERRSISSQLNLSFAGLYPLCGSFQGLR